MRIGIAGIGRLGLSLALNLDNCGFETFGYDVRDDYIEQVNNKTLKSTEPEVEILLKRSGFSATSNINEFYRWKPDLIFVVVPTPSDANHRYSHEYIEKFMSELYQAEVISSTAHQITDIVINSTVMPNYTDDLQKRYPCWRISYNPEFIAQGRIIRDQQHPDVVLIGERNSEAGNVIQSIYQKLCLNKPRYCRMSPSEAEITKIGINCFLSLKIGYANMIGDFALSKDLDPTKILQAIGADSRIGEKYFQWGYGPGGTCIPRDCRALARAVDDNCGLEYFLPVTNQRVCPEYQDWIRSIDNLHDIHLNFMVDRAVKQVKPKYTMREGVAFKKGTDIITDSQQLKMALKLVGKGFEVIIQDRKEVLSQVEKLYPGLFTLIEVSAE